MFKNNNGNNKLKIAFDFDDTLTDPLFFELAGRLISRGHDVWIMTARSSYEQYLAAWMMPNGIAIRFAKREASRYIFDFFVRKSVFLQQARIAKGVKNIRVVRNNFHFRQILTEVVL
ncbi:hypothetical protein AGMMS49982_13190 [Bacteroidia bacterium]|nr:hypothetical protein AGMMS49982_13190 [Bacteroidia bacterium]